MTNNRSVRNLPPILFVALVLVGSIGCRRQAVIEKGMAVRINYTLTVDGNVVDTSVGKQPLTYVQGSGQMIPGLEERLMGLKVGDKKHVTVPPEKAYGQINPNAQQKVSRKLFGDANKLKVGMMVNGQNGGRPVQAKVVAIGPKEITVDFNHPLAGKTLNFDIEVVEVKSAPPPAAPAQEAPARS